MGNYLLTDKVVPNMNKAWLEGEGKLFEERLMDVVIAARNEGGDLGGHRSSCMLVYDTEAALNVGGAGTRESAPGGLDKQEGGGVPDVNADGAVM